MPDSNSNLITLSDESIEQAIALCRLIERKHHATETTRKMASGIAEYLNQHGFLSRKQAEWLARNADYHKQPRPKELRQLSLTAVTEERRSLWADNNNDDDDEDKERDTVKESDVTDDVVSLLVSARKKLDAVMTLLNAHK